MKLFWKNLLLFFVILLVSSIMPVSAVETRLNSDQQILNDDEFEIVKECVETLISFVSSQEYTELTPEQDEYLDNHYGSMIAQSEMVIINLQDTLDYLNKEERKYKEINSTKTSKTRNVNPDILGEDAIAMEEYLDKQNIEITRYNWNYDILTKQTNETETVHYDKDKVILQIKDIDYVRYVQLVNITEDEIVVKSKVGLKSFKKYDFINQHTSNGDLNVFIVSNSTNMVYVFRVITTHQLDVLNKNINFYVSVNDLLKPAYNAYGIAVISTATLALVGVQGVMRAIGSLVINRYEEQGEASRLLPAYRGYVEEGQSQGWFRENWKRFTLIGAGIFITIGMASLIHHLSTLKVDWEMDKTNLLNEWGA